MLRGDTILTKFLESSAKHNKKKKKYRFLKELELSGKATVTDGNKTWVFVGLSFVEKLHDFSTKTKTVFEKNLLENIL